MTDKLDQDLPKGRIKKKKTLKDFAAHTLAVTVAFISTAFITILWNVRAKRRTKGKMYCRNLKQENCFSTYGRDVLQCFVDGMVV